jgi:DNA-binding CsgD family transcriptional regulator
MGTPVQAGEPEAGEPELVALAKIAGQERADLPPDGIPVSLLQDLMEHISCDRITVTGMDSTRQTAWFRQALVHGGEPEPPDPPAVASALTAAQWAHYWDTRSCSYPDRTGDRRRVTGVSDFYSARQWRSTGMYCDVYRPQGLEHMLTVCLTGAGAAPGSQAGPGRSVRMFLTRGPGPDFSRRDRALIQLLAPHLRQAYRDAELRRHGQPPRLTRRHWELLRLVAAGHTNEHIARRLGISVGTVRKHLETIFLRLGVSSRTAAVTRAFPQQIAV